MVHENTHTISVLVENEFGVLARIAGMFAARGFNIDALSVAPTSNPQYSRVTIITHGEEPIIEQIVKQLNRLIDVLKVVDVSTDDCVRRELMLLKVRLPNASEAQEKLHQFLTQHQGRLAEDQNGNILILEFVHEHKKNQEILDGLEDFEIIETIRTGNVAMQIGKGSFLYKMEESI